jgi:hypothetical protein
MALYNYDPKKFTFTLGAFPITGFQEGSNISLDPDSDISTTSMGVDKDFTRNINTNISWTLTTTLQNGSPANDILNSFIRSSSSLPFLIKDSNTNNTQATGICYIKSLPSLIGGLESEGREYVFTAVDVNPNYGGAS